MITLSNLGNFSRGRKKRRRVGRGIGSGAGKTCGRGTKGEGARSGTKTRLTYEGGQFRAFMKYPERGFSNAQFEQKFDVVNLKQIDDMYHAGETVNIDSLKEKGFLSGNVRALKILGTGELTKKVTIEAHAFSQTAKSKLAEAKIEFRELGK
ncbi:50S ribosomal protein L15 [Estrella lausannensis]|uniref:Large ribosomal subunit protein uL15 n=1 Tax=Estrella lausannensis TaxID=483423 RepID=A0A0H5DQL3_9BACT|nr:50S ribosomal protein L15 [Estrella lausannensis]CRX37864.1 50S ribosomal protein L15 [Estrella lausannensis]